MGKLVILTQEILMGYFIAQGITVQHKQVCDAQKMVHINLVDSTCLHSTLYAIHFYIYTKHENTHVMEL